MHPTTQLLTILRAHHSDISGDSLLLLLMFIGAILAFSTLVGTEKPLATLLKILVLELLGILLIYYLYPAAGISIGLGWIIIIVMVFLFTITEPKKRRRRN